MNLLRKNFILASIASVAMVGSLSSSSASALDGFSISDYLNKRPNLSGFLDFNVTSPIGNNCESANPESSISCNEGSSSSILYNQNEETIDYPYWGHDGDGIIFTNTDYLTDENGNISKRLRTANYGDRIDYSIKFHAVHQLEDDPDIVVTDYSLYGDEDYDSLRIDPESISITMDGGECPAEICSTSHSNHFYFKMATITYNRATQSYDYSRIVDDEGAEFEVTFSATLDGGILRDDNIFSSHLYLGKFNTNTKQNQGGSDSTPISASVRMGTIAIQKEDPYGKPLAGAKFKIDDVRAMNIGGKYLYAPEYGMFTEFETDENGLAIITGLPYGNYTVTEVEAPAGYLSDTGSKVVEVGNSNLTKYSYERMKIDYVNYDMTDYLMKDPRGGYSLHRLNTSGITEQSILTYSEQLDGYVNENGEVMLRRSDDGTYTFGATESALNFTQLADGLYAAKDEEDYGQVYRVKENADGTVTVTLGEDSKTVSLDENLCYFDDTPSLSRDGAWLCKYSDSYYLTAETDSITGFIPMPFDEASGEYRARFSSFRMYLKELDDDKIYFTYGAIVDYDENLQKWWSVFMPAFTLNTETITSHIRANGVKFINSPIGGEVPENVPNPQTSDAILKTLAIVVVCVLSAAIAKNRLLKR